MALVPPITVQWSMPAIILDQSNRNALFSTDEDHQWIVACLCADWCDVCKQYQPNFHRLADGEPNVRFVWIDIEDHADALADLDVENFPTLLIQRGETVHFFGPVLPEIGIAERLIQTYQAEYGASSDSLLGRSIASNPPAAQKPYQAANLRKLFTAD